MADTGRPEDPPDLWGEEEEGASASRAQDSRELEEPAWVSEEPTPRKRQAPVEPDWVPKEPKNKSGGQPQAFIEGEDEEEDLSTKPLEEIVDPIERMRVRHARQRAKERRKERAEQLKAEAKAAKSPLKFMSGGGAAGQGDENKELKGCLRMLVILLVVGGIGWGVQSQFDLFGQLFGGSEDLDVPTQRRSLTKVDAMEEQSKRTVQSGERTASQPTATRLTAPDPDAPPPEETASGSLPQSPGASRQVLRPTILGHIEQLAPTAGASTAQGSIDQVLDVMQEEQVCYQGRPARRVTSFYGLTDGFAVTFGPEGQAPPDPGPRLEFLPPNMGGKDHYYVTVISPFPVRGFEGDNAREIAADGATVGRTILSWIAEVADGYCTPAPAPASGPAAATEP
ncbi:MAG: hypothetical protein ACPGOY_11380 [Rhodospirillaceae bacterium]